MVILLTSKIMTVQIMNVENKVFNQMYQDLGIGLKLTSSTVVNVSNDGMAAFRDLILVLTSSRLAAKTRSMSTARLSQMSVIHYNGSSASVETQ